MNRSEFLRKQYNLSSDPFRIIAKKADIQMWVDREKELEKWDGLIEKSRASGVNTVAFIVGNYGLGKTMSLRKIQSMAQSKDDVFATYFTFKGEEKTKPGLDLIQRVFRSIDFEQLVEGLPDERIDAAIKRIPDALSECRSLLKSYYSVHRASLPKYDSDATNASAGRKPYRNVLAINVLRGQVAPRRAELASLGILRKIDSLDVAKEYLAGMLAFVRNLGYSSLVVIMDEFEYLFSLVTKSNRPMYVALIRDLYDFPESIPFDVGHLAGLSMFIGVSDSGWSSLNLMKDTEESTGGPTTALLRRVDDTTALTRFDKNYTGMMIELRLRYNRADGTLSKDPLIPFDETFVNFIFELTKGIPSYVMSRCDVVLNAGIAEKESKLTAGFAKRVLGDTRMLYIPEK